MLLQTFLATTLPLQPLRLLGGGLPFGLESRLFRGPGLFGGPLLRRNPCGLGLLSRALFGLDPRALAPVQFGLVGRGPLGREPGRRLLLGRGD